MNSSVKKFINLKNQFFMTDCTIYWVMFKKGEEKGSFLAKKFLDDDLRTFLMRMTNETTTKFN